MTEGRDKYEGGGNSAMRHRQVGAGRDLAAGAESPVGGGRAAQVTTEKPVSGAGGRDDILEQLVGDLARAQRLRRAPVSLEQRVLGQLALRHPELPWWRRGFAHWPLTAQAAFLVVSVGFMRLAFVAVLSVISLLASQQVTGTALSWVHEGGRAAALIASVTSFVLRAIPTEWLYVAAAAGFVLYAVLFGLSAVAYRTLYAER